MSAEWSYLLHLLEGQLGDLGGEWMKTGPRVDDSPHRGNGMNGAESGSV